MAWGDLLKGAANAFLDEYEITAKRNGHYDTAQSAKNLKDLLNGKVDINGNPIKYDSDQEDW